MTFLIIITFYSNSSRNGFRIFLLYIYVCIFLHYLLIEIHQRISVFVFFFLSRSYYFYVIFLFHLPFTINYRVQMVRVQTKRSKRRKKLPIFMQYLLRTPPPSRSSLSPDNFFFINKSFKILYFIRFAALTTFNGILYTATLQCTLPLPRF